MSDVETHQSIHIDLSSLNSIQDAKEKHTELTGMMDDVNETASLQVTFGEFDSYLAVQLGVSAIKTASSHKADLSVEWSSPSLSNTHLTGLEAI